MKKLFFIFVLCSSFCQSQTLIWVSIVSSEKDFSAQNIKLVEEKINSEWDSYDEPTQTRALEYLNFLKSKYFLVFVQNFLS